MKEKLKALYYQEIDQFHLDFDQDPEYQVYYTQAQELWEGKDMPGPVYLLLETSNFLSFVHGFRLALELAGWVRGDGGYTSSQVSSLSSSQRVK